MCPFIFCSSRRRHTRCSRDWSSDVCSYDQYLLSSRRRHTRCSRDWSSDVCSSDLVLVARRVRQLDWEAQGRGALRDRLARRTTELFGARAPLVAALVFAPNAALDPDVRERYARSGLAHILSISGLHVGFLAAWLALILRRLGLSPRAPAGAAASLPVAYPWPPAFPAPG